jgi:hypothetical protein
MGIVDEAQATVWFLKAGTLDCCGRSSAGGEPKVGDFAFYTSVALYIDAPRPYRSLRYAIMDFNEIVILVSV